MKDFEYLEPRTVAEVCEFLDKYEEAKLLAGGSSLVNLMKTNLVTPGYLINLKTVPDLASIEYDNKSGTRIGAMVTDQDVIESPVIGERYPLLVEAGRHIASVGIRNQSTIGGNICHADPSADFPPALIALNAHVKIVSSKGQRTIPVEELFVDYLECALEPNEVLTEIEIPKPLPGSGWSFLELNKTSNSAAVVSVAAIINLDSDGRCQQASLALGSAGNTPIKVGKISDILIGQRVDSNLIEAVALEAQRVCNPISDVFGSAEYKRKMVKVLTTRALNEAVARAKAISS